MARALTDNSTILVANLLIFSIVFAYGFESTLLENAPNITSTTIIQVCSPIKQANMDGLNQIHAVETLHQAQGMLRDLRSNGETGHIVIELCSSSPHAHNTVLDIDERDTSPYGDTIFRGNSMKVLLHDSENMFLVKCSVVINAFLLFMQKCR